MENRILPGPPYPHVDVDGQAAFLMGALSACSKHGPIEGIFVIAHGATIALVDESGLVLPVLDYEHAGPDELAKEYDRLRPPFARSGSPRMPGGLNIGAQLFWQRAHFPDQVARAKHALFWPQYWTWRLTGRAVSEISYASSHGDIWDLTTGAPAGGEMAAVTDGLFPAIAPAQEVAGSLRPELARAHGLPDGIPVFVGAHDSSLALVPHAGAGARTPSVVMSTGTWLTAFAIGTERVPEAELPGVMASLDVFGRLVPNFRLMAGKARADILACDLDPLPEARGIDCALWQDPESGTFRLVHSRTGQPVRPDRAAGDTWSDQVDRILAREAVRGMRAIGADGPVHITGPFAGNAAFVGALREDWHLPIEPSGYEQGLVAQIKALLGRTGA